MLTEWMNRKKKGLSKGNNPFSSSGSENLGGTCMILLWKNRKSRPQPEWSPSPWLHQQRACPDLESWKHGSRSGALGSAAQSTCPPHTAAFSILLECEIWESDRIYFQIWELRLTNTFSRTAIMVGWKKTKKKQNTSRPGGRHLDTHIFLLTVLLASDQ